MHYFTINKGRNFQKKIFRIMRESSIECSAVRSGDAVT